MAENLFTRKIGPLPMWGWLGIAGAGVVGVVIWERRSHSKTSGSQPAYGYVPPVVEQFRLSTPPEQDRDIDDDDPTHRHRRHHRRKHPDHDKDDKRKPGDDDGRMGGGGTGPPPMRGTAPTMVRRQARL